MHEQHKAPVHEPPPGMAPVVERNIRKLIDRRRREEAARGGGDRVADAAARFAGSMWFVYLHLAAVLSWVAVNLGRVPGVPPFDPSFVILATAASVEAIFLSTFVLITQNRMTAAADRRANLDLHVSLLAEHEVTRLVTLVTTIAAKLGVEEARAPELAELAKDVAPEKVLDRIEAPGPSNSDGAYKPRGIWCASNPFSHGAPVSDTISSFRTTSRSTSNSRGRSGATSSTV